MGLNLFSGVCSGTTSFRAAMWVPCPWHTAKSWERSWTCCCLWLSRRHSGAYSCQNSGHRNYPSLNCVRSQSSTTPSKTSSHISHIPMAHSITAFRLQLLHPPTFRSPRRPQVSQPGSATALLSQQLTQLLLAQLLVLSNYLEHLSSAQSHMGMLNQELLNCFPLFNIDVP